MGELLWVNAIVKALVLPPAGPLFIAMSGFILARRFPRTGRAIALSGVLILFGLSTPIVGIQLLRFVDMSPPFEAKLAGKAQAMVILGGGVRRDAAEYGGDTLGRLTLERVRYGARVGRATGLPILVAGGSLGGSRAEALLMQEALQTEFGLPVRWVEASSRNTHENAVRSAEILRAEHIHRVVLVAHSFDMPRAKAEFLSEGIEVIPAPTGIPSWRFDTVLDLLPSLSGLQSSYYATYEILAEIARRVKQSTRI